MHATHVSEQLWVFTCQHCGNRWSVTYEAHHTEGLGGMDYCVWSHHGRPSLAPAPTACQACPSCDSLDVTGEQAAPERWRG